MALTTQSAPSATRLTTDSAVVFFDGGFLPLERANVNIATHALHYGTGCFEGIRGYWVEEQEELYVLKLQEHVERFFRSCSVLRLRPRYSQEEFASLILQVLRLNGYRSDVYIRPLAFKSTQTIKLTLSTLDDSFAIFAFPFGHYAHREDGLRVCVSPWRRIDDNAIPTRAKVTGSYINASLASDDAAQAGFDEALMLSADGSVAEASSANIFLVRGNTLVTPDLSGNILEGITREAVMELARTEMGLEVRERSVGRSELYIADEIFLCGTGLQIEAVSEVDGRMIGKGRPGPVTSRLQALYADAVRRRIPQYADWCVPVYAGTAVES